MILSFMIKWKDTGEPTYFVEKILSGILWEHDNQEECDQLYKEYRERRGFKKDYPSFTAKIHTIRADEKDRWKPGVKIHFYDGRPDFGGGKRFAPVIKCVSVQEIEFKWSTATPIKVNFDDTTIKVDDILELYSQHGREVVDSNSIEKSSSVQVLIDGIPIKDYDVLISLAKNDGFESLEDFFNYFNISGVYKLIHWTDLKY